MSSSVVAGMAWQDIAKSAYQAYSASTGNKNFRGDPMPEFDALPRPIQIAWEAAVRHAECVQSCAATYGPTPEEMEKFTHPQRWAGWKPPEVG